MAAKSTNNYEGNIVDNPTKNEICYGVSRGRNTFIKFLRPKYYRKSLSKKTKLRSYYDMCVYDRERER